MTADPARRRRGMLVGLVAGVVALVATAALGYVAVVAMVDSQAGRDARPDDRPVVSQRLPWTATALIGVVDDDGQLTSSAVAILDPDHRGGTIVTISPSADAGSGLVEQVRPLRATFAVDGGEAWRSSIELMTGLAFDVAEVVDEQRFSQLMTPLGELPVRFPFAFTDARTGRSFEAGDQVLSTREAATVLTAQAERSPSQLDGARTAVWEAVADRVGAGIGSLPEGIRFDVRTPPAGLDQFLDALFTAPVDFRALEAVAPSDAGEELADRIDDDFVDALGPGLADDVVFHRRAEVAMVFASVAPARIGAPLQGPTIRLVSGFTDDDAAPLGLNRSDLIAAALDVFFFSQSNVVSVVDQPGAAVPDVTRMLVADPADVDDVWEVYPEALGEVQVAADDVPIQGVAIEVTLGRDFVRVLADRMAAADDDGTEEAPADTVDDVAGTDG